jgi:hypothetical protein
VTNARTSAATAASATARTGAKHERWIRELAGAGWTVIQAGHIELVPCHNNMQEDYLEAHCQRCKAMIGDWPNEDWIPLPRVLHAVSGHTCEERR